MPQAEKNTQVYFEELDIKYCIFITAINVNISLSLILLQVSRSMLQVPSHDFLQLALVFLCIFPLSF